MTLRSYILDKFPGWDTFPENLRKEYLPKLQFEYRLMKSGPIGRAKVRFMKMSGHRYRNPQNTFDMAIEALKQEGAL